MPLDSASDLRDRAIAILEDGRTALSANDATAESLFRRALELFVHAFLESRRANADLFALAHALGAEIEDRWGCRYMFDAASSTFVNRCPVFALHARFGFSPAWTVLAHCSICEAPEFECDHVGGEFYDGAECVFIADRILDVGSFDIVRNPEFVETFVRDRTVPRAEFEQAVGRPPLPDDIVRCRHCVVCEGRNGAEDVDLDPSRWPPLSDS